MGANSSTTALEILVEPLQSQNADRVRIRITLHLPVGNASSVRLFSHVETATGPQYDPFSFFLINRRTGKEYHVPLSGARDASTRVILRLSPGEDLVHLIEFDRRLHASGLFLPEGTYSLTCSYRVNGPDPPNPSRRPPHQVAEYQSPLPMPPSNQDDPFWTGRIDSSPIEIRIGPRAK